MITYSNVNEYVRELVKIRDKQIICMEKYAENNKVPIIKPEVASLLLVMGNIIKPTKILEVGTAIGYSSIIMSKTLSDKGRIDTIERSPKMLGLARRNVFEAGLSKKINIIEGEAQGILRMIDSKYDMIFLDGAKGQYIDFLYDLLRLLNSRGVLIADNVLFRGMVAENGKIARRQKTLVTNLKAFLKEITNLEQLETSILPFGDGVTISYKK